METPLYVAQFYIPVQIRVHKTGWMASPWGAPLILWIESTEVGTSLPCIAIASEFVIQEFYVDSPLSKESLEKLHIERFRTDYRNARGELPFRDVSIGANPPDFEAVSSNVKIGVDCIQFGIQSRRTAHALFVKLKNNISHQNRERFDHLTGSLVYLWFRTERAVPNLPPSNSHKNVVTELIDSLEKYKYDPQKPLGNFVGNMPDKLPDLGFESTSKGNHYYAIPFQGPMPSTPFFQQMGFEMALHFSSYHTSTSLWEILRKNIAAHDKPGIDTLVITVGGPDNNGYRYLSEEVLFSLLLSRPEPLPDLSNVKEVYLHTWTQGQIILLCPHLQVISRGVFTQFIPGHNLR